MKLFLDSANLDEIKKVKSWGILDGVTTNPSLMKKVIDGSNKKITMEDYISSIFEVCGKEKSVSLEVIGTYYNAMMREAEILNEKFGELGNICIKIPINPYVEENDPFKKILDTSLHSIRAIKKLSEKNISVNATLIFTPEQALLAAKAGAKYVSPFAGRMDDYIRQGEIKFEGKDYYPAEGTTKKSLFMGGRLLHKDGIVSGVDLVKKCVDLLKISGLETEVIAASLRNTRQFQEVGLVGAHIATVPFGVIKDLLYHPKTEEGMKGFLKDTTQEYAELFKKVV